MSHLLLDTNHSTKHDLSTCFSRFSLMPMEPISIRLSGPRRGYGFTTPPMSVSQPLSTTDIPQPLATTDPTLSAKGLCYNDPNLTWAFKDTSVGWVYNWAAQPGGSISEGFEYVPMLWGTGSIPSWFSDATNAINAGAGHLLSFNEPDIPEQANIAPEEAARAHILAMTPFVGRARIGSPAVSNGAIPEKMIGLVWLESFLSTCQTQNFTTDFVTFHWYDDASQFDAFEPYIGRVINLARTFGIERVWLTEFGVFGSNEEILQFLSAALVVLGRNQAIERYAYFMCSDGILIDGSRISSLGNIYIGQ